jgi:hypothetical protein
MTFAIWGAIAPSKRVYIYRCHFWVKKTTRVWATDIGRLSEGENIVRNPLDPSAWQERGHELTISQEYEQFSGMVPEEADNDRVQGCALIHEYLRWLPREARKVPEEGYNQEIAMRILRINGVKAHEEYLNLFKPEEPETNLPLLQIFEATASTGTRTLIDTIPIAQYAEKNKEDYEEFEGDDPIDTLRYFLKASSVYIEDVLAKTKYFEQEAEIIRDLNATGNMFSYYQRMAFLESKKKSEMPKPVRRFH